MSARSVTCLSLALAACAMTFASRGTAQVVGHLPDAAIMKDLFDGQRIGPFAGWFSAGPDPVGVHAHSGPIAGIRYTVVMSGPLYFSMRAFGVKSEHDVYLPNAPVTNRRAGTASANLIGGDAGMELALTGERSWRGIQPLLTGSVGAIAGVANAFDAGGYAPGVSPLFTYGIALRFATGRNGEFRTDVGWMVHQVRYPEEFRTTLSGDAAALRASGSLTPMTSNRVISFSWTWGVFR